MWILHPTSRALVFPSHWCDVSPLDLTVDAVALHLHYACTCTTREAYLVILAEWGRGDVPPSPRTPRDGNRRQATPPPQGSGTSRSSPVIVRFQGSSDWRGAANAKHSTAIHTRSILGTCSIESNSPSFLGGGGDKPNGREGRKQASYLDFTNRLIHHVSKANNE